MLQVSTQLFEASWPVMEHQAHMQFNVELQSTVAIMNLAALGTLTSAFGPLEMPPNLARNWSFSS